MPATLTNQQHFTIGEIGRMCGVRLVGRSLSSRFPRREHPARRLVSIGARRVA